MIANYNTRHEFNSKYNPSDGRRVRITLFMIVIYNIILNTYLLKLKCKRFK